MKNTFAIILSLLLVPLGSAARRPMRYNSTTARIELLNSLWLFNTSQPAQSTLTAMAPQAKFAAPADNPLAASRSNSPWT